MSSPVAHVPHERWAHDSFRPEASSFSVVLLYFCFFFKSLRVSSLSRKRFYPGRSAGQAVVTGAVPSPPRYVPLFFVAHRVEHSQLLVMFHRMYLTHAHALSANVLFYGTQIPYEHALGETC